MKPEKQTWMQVGLYESGWRQTEFNIFYVGNNNKTVREQKKCQETERSKNE